MTNQTQNLQKAISTIESIQRKLFSLIAVSDLLGNQSSDLLKQSTIQSLGSFFDEELIHISHEIESIHKNILSMEFKSANFLEVFTFKK